MVILTCSPCQYVQAFDRWLVNRGDTNTDLTVSSVCSSCRCTCSVVTYTIQRLLTLRDIYLAKPEIVCLTKVSCECVKLTQYCLNFIF